MTDYVDPKAIPCDRMEVYHTGRYLCVEMDVAGNHPIIWCGDLVTATALLKHLQGTVNALAVHLAAQTN